MGVIAKSLVAQTSAVLAAAVLLACSYQFEVTAVDLTTTTPRFQIHPTKGFGWSSTQPLVTEIVVADTSGPPGTPRTMWRVTSKSGVKLAEIVYGQTPRGFDVELEPKLLKDSDNYDLSVVAPGGGGGLRFSITTNGAGSKAHDT